MIRSWQLAGIAAWTVGLGCSGSSNSLTQLSFERPTDIAFACFGDYVVNGGIPGAADSQLVRSAQPVGSCLAHASGTAPAGQEDPNLVAPGLSGFVLQSSRGTVAVIDLDTGAVRDADPGTPGNNAIPMGNLPVGLATDQSGCFLLSANAGSCDVASLDISSALALNGAARVRRIGLTSPAGVPLLARPSAIASGPEIDEIGRACLSGASGVFYATFPGCGLLAAFDGNSGMALGGVTFAADGTAALADEASFLCAKECPDDASPGAATAEARQRPGLLTLQYHQLAGQPARLYVSAPESSALTVVDLDDTGIPQAISAQIALEGKIEVTDIAVSDTVAMGGDLLTDPASVGDFQFAYLVASDKTVRVVDLGTGVECDTQVDPRFLKNEANAARLQCLPVGAAETPPRRAGARSPGIEVPGIPLAVTFATTSDPDPADVAAPSPTRMHGTFAYVTSTNGLVWIVNVDDNNYPDVEDPTDPMRVFLGLAMPHVPRDFVELRDELAPTCATPDPNRLFYGPRLADAPSLVFSNQFLAGPKVDLVPFFRTTGCLRGDSNDAQDETIVPELSFASAAQLRDEAFPDLRRTQSEDWSLIWEGSLSNDGPLSDVDGPAVRKAVFGRSGPSLQLIDRSAPFCELGTQPYDVVSIAGCDPLLGDSQCGVGETCFVHPDAPVGASSGLCFPSREVDAASSLCRDFLISDKRYSVVDLKTDSVLLGERHRLLRTTPKDGCDSDEQCAQLALLEEQLTSPEHPLLYVRDPNAVDRSWTCGPDPSRAGDVPRCLMSCESEEDCEAGFVCGGAGLCIQGTIPPAECLRAAQRYQVSAGEAFALIGERTGFLHNVQVDEATGDCVADPNGNPFHVGRVALDVAPCDNDSDPATGPNPCATTVSQRESVVPFVEQAGLCSARPVELRTREAVAIRIENSVFRFHLVDPFTRGDAVCNGDGAGAAPEFAMVYPGLQLNFEITGGFFPMFVENISAAQPVRLRTGPDGRVWVLDAGDTRSSSGQVIQGQVFSFTPEDAALGFSPVTIR